MKLTKRKGFNFFRSYYDVYNELDDNSKVKFMDALLDRQFLGVKPTDLTGMSKFAYISQTNSIDSQVKGYEDKTGTSLTDNSTPPTVGVNEKENTPILQVEVQEKGKEKGKDKKTPVFNFRKSLLDLGADKDLANDWIKVRKTKKATNSETAFNSFASQLKQSKLSINQVLEQCVVKSWAGFNAEWMKDVKSIMENTDSEDMVIYYWKNESSDYKRKIPKNRAEAFFKNQAGGGYIPVIVN